MRLFLAIALPAPVRDALRDAVDRLRDAQPSLLRASDFKWVLPANFHVTLKFLGEVQEPRVPAIIDGCRAATQQTPPFQLALRPIVTEPSSGRVRLIVGELSGDIAAATTLAERLETSLHMLGFGRERRPFWPHVTLARARTPQRLSGEQRERWPALVGPPIQDAFGVDHVALMSSQLRPSGPIYALVERLPLG